MAKNKMYRYRNGSRNRSRNKKSNPYSSISLVLLCAAILLACAIKFFGSDSKSPPKAPAVQNDGSGFTVHYIDVGQGDCTLVETDDGKFVMIDAGTNDCEYELLRYLDSRNVEYIEYLFLTHPHEDHIGSADAVLNAYNVKNVVKTALSEDNATCERLDNAIKESERYIGTKVTIPETGDKFYVDGIEFLILSDGKDYEDVNNSSLCIRMEMGESTFIFTGDAEKSVEYDILDGDFDIDAEVLKCGHHGSSTSSCDAFLNEVSPDIAIISCAKGNMYGHPHVEVLESLLDRSIAVYRTDIDSTVVLDCDADSIKLVTSED